MLIIFVLNYFIICLNAGRILSSVKDVDCCKEHNDVPLYEDPQKGSQSMAAHISHFLPTSRRIVQFSNGKVLHPQFLKLEMDNLASHFQGLSE